MRYLFTTLPSNDLGLITRSLPIGRELRDRGHRVVFCSPAKAPRKMIADAGFDNCLPKQPLYHVISGDVVSFESLRRLLRSQHLVRDLGIIRSLIRQMRQSSTAEIVDIDHFMSVSGMWNEAFVKANVETLIEIIESIKPDAIVDFWNPFACMAARICGKALISVIQADMHPGSNGFIWWKDTSNIVYRSPVPAVNRVLAEHHLAPVKKTGDLLIGNRTLVLGLPELDPLPATADVTYVGPILWEKEDDRMPPWLSGLSKEQPVIWLYPGNLRYVRGSRLFADSEIVLQACREALGRENVQVVLSTGHHELPKEYLPLPPNFRHEAFVPGLAMAKRSDLLIHHGGYGSCQTGLYTGTPALIIPTYSERESNARRIASQGAGDFILPESDSTGKFKRVSAEAVRTKVFNMLSDASFSENAIRISGRMKTYGGAPEAARLIEAAHLK